jgi:hypothetical protein
VPALATPPGRDIGHLLGVRQHVVTELNDVRAIKALFSGRPDMAAYAR